LNVLIKTLPALYLLATWAASGAMAQGIYTCTDGKGRKITSDRPIAECIDRSQQEITPSGTVKRVLGPTLTAQERAALEEKEKAEAEARLLLVEEKRRNRALLSRYPNRAAHDRERAIAVAQVDEVVKAGVKRAYELVEQRKAINIEMEFYKGDINKATPALKRRVDENDNNMAAQKRSFADQDSEKQRINLRFDEELAKLKVLWAMMAAPITPAAPIAPNAAGLKKP
jgi:Domain of unknown function (DUF4124)